MAGLLRYPIVQGENAYDSNVTLSKYNSAISLMKAGYTIFLVCIVAYCFMVITGALMERTQYGRATCCRSASLVGTPTLKGSLLLCCNVSAAFCQFLPSLIASQTWMIERVCSI